MSDDLSLINIICLRFVFHVLWNAGIDPYFMELICRLNDNMYEMLKTLPDAQCMVVSVVNSTKTCLCRVLNCLISSSAEIPHLELSLNLFFSVVMKNNICFLKVIFRRFTVCNLHEFAAF